MGTRGFSDFERRRLTDLAKDLERALESSRLQGAKGVLGQLRSVFDRIYAGTLTAPVRRAPSGRYFQESDLRSDPRITSLWHSFCNAVEGKSQGG